ncbi:MAG: C40 family peptidase [Bacteroidales bacterium]|nr:C40 family peptidase [Bacteroidales bacterium]MDD4604241.1 C40 family peptidase [Bacteroidales bacterium]
MEFGICLHSIIPVRFEPNHTSEMVTQILFGELYRVIGKENGWCRVQLAYDDCEGWIHPLQLNLLTAPEFLRLYDSESAVTFDLVQLISNETRHTMIPVLIGSSLPDIKEQHFTINQETFLYEGVVSDTMSLEHANAPQEIIRIRQSIVKDAMIYLNAPYLWGGRSPFGIDCSGFVQMAYKLRKIKLLRNASQQATQGEVVSLLAESGPCDLAFFDDEEGNITHVGLLIDRSHIIHCSGKVRIDPLDHEGIFNEEKQQYSHKLRLIKRII